MGELIRVNDLRAMLGEHQRDGAFPTRYVSS
jgi:hypothetical protein